MLAMANRSRLWLSFHHLSSFVFLLSFIHVHSFGVSPHDFHPGDLLEVKANKLTSNKTKLSLSYYSVPYCRPRQIINSVQDLGQIFRGDHIQNSPYRFDMRREVDSEIVCRVTLNEKTAKEFKEKIDDGYRANMILDDLPLVVPITTKHNDSQPLCQQGYFIGGKVRCANKDKYFINNHLSFIVSYHRNAETRLDRIVGFEAKAFSINNRYANPVSDETSFAMCDPQAEGMVTSSHPPQEVDDKKEIFFTFTVEFKETDAKWASRWETYNHLIDDDDQIHWFPIVYSLMNVLLLSVIVAAGMLGILYRSISNYKLEILEEGQEETGWKLIHTDVFRPPVNSELLCVCVGTGVQCYGVIVITIIFGFLGFLSPLNTGGLMTDVILLWAIMGIFGGYAMARLYKTFEGSEWIKTTLKTACMFPGLVFCILLVLNVVKWSDGSWGPVPSLNMFVLAVLWFGLSLPLIFLGSYIGFKRPEIPVKTNEIPREIPKQSWYASLSFSIMIGGIIPFGAVFNELFSVITLIGLPQFYYMFGLMLVALIIICVELTIFLCYFQLCGEDYQWWWRSYLTSGSLAFYLFIYSTFYFFTKLNITELVPSVLYFGYMLIASCALFVLMGTIGFYACLWFTRLIYSSMKIV